MFELYICVVPDPLAQLDPYEGKSAYEFETQEQAELRALLYLHYCPNDIVMLVEYEVGLCKHCETPIREKSGWVVHQWIHEDGYYTCLPDGNTKAEPA